MGARVRRRWWAAVFVVALAGCGDPAATGPATTEPAPDERPTQSEAFLVAEVPEGYEPVAAGVGKSLQHWGDDEIGTDEPFTVLAPAGSTDPDERVLVTTTGFEGYQGELHQTLYGYPSAEPEELTVDGREALHVPGSDEHPAQLVAVRGDDLAVRVLAPGATLEELEAILSAVEAPQDRALAPRVPSPPDGLVVVGSVDATAVVALHPHVRGDTERLWGLDSMHVAGWERATRPFESKLTVATLPTRAAMPEVLPVVERWLSPTQQREWRDVEVGGRPGIVLDEDEPESGWTQRQVWRWADWGIVVVSSDGSELLTEQELVELAEGVAPAEGDEWDRFVEEMSGGSGLHPDRGRQEITRGTWGDLEWLLQTGPAGDGNYREGVDPRVFDGVDSCLKLSDGRRACVAAMTSSASPHEWVGRGGDNHRGSARIDELVVVSTTEDAASVRITTPADSTEAPLVPVPGGQARAAVAFVEGAGLAVCADQLPMEPPDSITLMRVEVLDMAGNVVGCVGIDSGGA